MVAPRYLLAIPAIALFVLCLGYPAPTHSQDAAKQAQPDRPESDRRLGTLKDLNGYFPFEVPKLRQAWDERAESCAGSCWLRSACGLSLSERRPRQLFTAAWIAMGTRSRK